MQSLPPPERRSGLLQEVGLLLSALVGLAVTVGLFAVGAVVVAILGGLLLLIGGGIALALKLGWRPALLRQADALRQRSRREQPLDGEYTVSSDDDQPGR